MRNAAELEAAALATGTYANYVGDGASVPWQVFSATLPPVGFTMWAYKAYLDARFPNAFKLHDWCYTPYGALINVTRQEADSGMRELIAQVSPIDAEIVYQAVTLAGDPYFGVSQTGYTGPQVERPVDNIVSASGRSLPAIQGALGTNAPDSFALAIPAIHVTSSDVLLPFSEGFPMSSKIVFKFNGHTTAAPPQASIGYVGAEHSFGFSEHTWLNTDDLVAIKSYCQIQYGPTRTALLPSNITLIGATVYLSGTGRGIDIPLGFQGQTGTQDQVNVGILCESRNPSAVNQRRWWVHALPDEMLTNGEFRPTVAQALSVSLYFAAMGVGYWLGQSRSNVQEIVTISNTGLVSLAVNHPYAVGQFLKINRTVNASGKQFGGTFQVATVGPLATQFTLASWNGGDCLGGTIFQESFSLKSFAEGDGPYVVRAGTKRVGRPFDLYRGRQSVKR
jgi:hypothetical protein